MKIKLVPFLLSCLLFVGCSSNLEIESHRFLNADQETSLTYDLWDGTKSSFFSAGQGTMKNPYIIGSAKDLAYLQSQVSKGTYYSGSYFELNCNIDLNNIAWGGIGNGYSSGAFKGTLDGKNHYIKNIKMDAQSASRKGFFNSNSGKISNLNLIGSLTGGAIDSSCFGLFAGINYGEINNVNVDANVEVKGIYVGGLIGCNAGGNIYNSSVTSGLVKGTNLVGGIIGYNMVSSGVIGSVNYCENYATITAKDYLNENYSGIGGIVGTCGSGTSINECVNYGDVNGEGNSVGGTGGIVGNNFNTLITNCTNKGTISSYQNAGGIIGYSRNAHNVAGCVNEGDIIGDIAIGGIVGYNRTKIYNCTNEGRIIGDKHNISYWIGGIVGMNGSNVIIDRSINKGLVYGVGSSSGGVGGIAGSNYSSTITNCENHADIEGMYRVGGIVGFSQNNGGFILDSINYGNFITTATYGTVSLGGIIGYNQASVIGCENYGQYLFKNNGYFEMYGYIVGYDTIGSSKVYNNINHKN